MNHFRKLTEHADSVIPVDNESLDAIVKKVRAASGRSKITQNDMVSLQQNPIGQLSQTEGSEYYFIMNYHIIMLHINKSISRIFSLLICE